MKLREGITISVCGYPDQWVNSLKIQANCTHDIFIGREPLGDDVRIIHNVTTEEERSTDGKDEVHRTAEGEEDPDQASHH